MKTSINYITVACLMTALVSLSYARKGAPHKDRTDTNEVNKGGKKSCLHARQGFVSQLNNKAEFYFVDSPSYTPLKGKGTTAASDDALFTGSTVSLYSAGVRAWDVVLQAGPSAAAEEVVQILRKDSAQPLSYTLRKGETCTISKGDLPSDFQEIATVKVWAQVQRGA
jgi:hypothetical protein